MSHPFLDGMLIGGGAVLGANLVADYLTPASETSIWSGAVDNAVMSASRVTYRGRSFLRLYVVADGRWATVGACWQYPEMIALIQTWERYLLNGGTVQAWLANNTYQASKVAALEQSGRLCSSNARS